MSQLEAAHSFSTVITPRSDKFRQWEQKQSHSFLKCKPAGRKMEEGVGESAQKVCMTVKDTGDQKGWGQGRAF